MLPVVVDLQTCLYDHMLHSAALRSCIKSHWLASTSMIFSLTSLSHLTPPKSSQSLVGSPQILPVAPSNQYMSLSLLPALISSTSNCPSALKEPGVQASQGPSWKVRSLCVSMNGMSSLDSSVRVYSL